MRAMVSPGPMDDGGGCNFRSFGDSTKFEDEEDRQAAMADYEFDRPAGHGPRDAAVVLGW